MDVREILLEKRGSLKNCFSGFQSLWFSISIFVFKQFISIYNPFFYMRNEKRTPPGGAIHKYQSKL